MSVMFAICFQCLQVISQKISDKMATMVGFHRERISSPDEFVICE